MIKWRWPYDLISASVVPRCWRWQIEFELDGQLGHDVTLDVVRCCSVTYTNGNGRCLPEKTLQRMIRSYGHNSNELSIGKPALITHSINVGSRDQSIENEFKLSTNWHNTKRWLRNDNNTQRQDNTWNRFRTACDLCWIA